MKLFESSFLNNQVKKFEYTDWINVIKYKLAKKGIEDKIADDLVKNITVKESVAEIKYSKIIRV